jgi:hypothetical protein
MLPSFFIFKKKFVLKNGIRMTFIDKYVVKDAIIDGSRYNDLSYFIENLISVYLK